ncbi:MAG: uL15 family ribosomal protein, partial [Firmicutes bacterium]|nr:uL15 family ribosomal protein [Bacillota bacterium]
AIVNVKDLNCFDDGSIVTVGLLRAAGLVNKITAGVKLLGDGELEKKLTVQVQKCSRQAEEKITAKGGKFEVI